MYREQWPSHLLRQSSDLSNLRLRRAHRVLCTAQDEGRLDESYEDMRTFVTLPSWCSTVSATPSFFPCAVWTRAIWNWRKNLGPLSFARSADDPGCDCDAGSQTTCLERGVRDTHAHAGLECEVIVQLVLQRREVGFRRVAGRRELLPAKRRRSIRMLSALTSQDKSTHSANPTGESVDFWKSIVLYATPPDVMSGTPGATCTYG
jgi:hypothetical protein